ncbi:MAG: histidine kinase dimerization/phosphoacceptor domain-containing protein, partial [Thermoleophilia bacterium]|nr:histidine kinase dimerization/phosphoacceptor domain-containing protein [Thermoleophilia bacterium]
MTPVPARLRLAVAAAALCLGGLSLAVGVNSSHTDARALFVALDLAVGWSFTASGLVAWSRRPGNRIGPLMVALGLDWLIGSLQLANSPVLYTVGLLTAPLALALVAHLVLAYPEGVLAGAAARTIAGAAYADATLLQLAALLQYDPRAPRFDCDGCPANVILAARDDAAAEAIFTAQNALGVAIAAGVLLLLRRRWRGATAPARRSLAPVLISGGVTAALGVLLFVSVAARSLELPARAATYAALATVPLAFLVGLLRTRLARSAVSRLVVELGRAPAPGRVREAIARALGDPSLELAYWLPESGSYVDAHGRPVSLPGPASGRAVAPVEREGRLIGALVHDVTLADQPELVDGVRAAAALALENGRLQAELRARLEELRASRARLVEAGDAERRRLERNLHDGAQQRLIGVALTLRMAEARVVRDPEEAAAMLGSAREELMESL